MNGGVSAFWGGRGETTGDNSAQHETSSRELIAKAKEIIASDREEVEQMLTAAYSNNPYHHMPTIAEGVTTLGKEMHEIESQGGFNAFFSKGDNIKQVAAGVGKLSDFSRKMLDMIILLMGGTAKNKRDYDHIISTIDRMTESGDVNTGTLRQLLEIKTAVQETQKRYEIIATLRLATADLLERAERFEGEIERTNGAVIESKAVVEEMMVALQSSLKALKERYAHLEQSFSDSLQESSRAFESLSTTCDELKDELRRQNVRGIIYAAIAAVFSAVVAVGVFMIIQ